ncbi:sucrose-phosphatase [Musa troglodytarum]|uniref:sucrose-phosphate phosphatase n=2 Tax=Musa troglodytarum TaxID=320322 RepID=A0A9E7EKY6_9LILI|nr:sucrose-phosphatase [Musa troglodytarum]
MGTKEFGSNACLYSFPSLPQTIFLLYLSPSGGGNQTKNLSFSPFSLANPYTRNPIFKPRTTSLTLSRRRRIANLISGPLSWKMDRLDGPARLMIVSDLDHTMVDHHDPENTSLLRFNALWESLYRHDSLLVFSTGRSPTLYKQLRSEKPMLTPDITITSVGTEITYGDSMVPDEGWVNVLNQKWDRNVVLEETAKLPQLKFQSETEQRPHKVSFYVEKGHAQDVISSLSDRFEKRGLDVKIIYSGGIDLDILPQGAGKGQALAYLLKKFKEGGKPPINTLVCGDSGNDAELFSIPDVYGVMVSNAQEELLQWHAEHAKENTKIIHASNRCAAGIIEAIGHFGLGPNTSPRDSSDILVSKLDNFNPSHEVVKFYITYERWRRAEAEKSDLLIQSLKHICHPTGIAVHPSGVEHSLHECIDTFGPHYGDKQGKQFRVWLDRVFTSQIGSTSWLVKFDKWELTDDGRHCSLTTILLNSEPGNPGAFSLLHVHQTWLEGFAARCQNDWIF